MNKDLLYTLRWDANQIIQKSKDPVVIELAGDQVKILTTILNDEPEAPKGDIDRTKDVKYEPPQVAMIETNIKASGAYQTKSGKPKGVVIHWTMGRPGGRTESISMLNYLGSQGWGCFVMDRDGIVYVPKEIGFEKWDHHAGSSSWKGELSVSRLCMGIEVMCPGKLAKIDGKYYAHYDLVDWNPAKGPTKNAKPIDGSLVRYVTKDGACDEGYYYKYTEAQEKALIDFCLWQLDVNPEFEIDWIVGHDEVAPNRKSDPGGSLSMTMPEFRAKIRELWEKRKGDK